MIAVCSRKARPTWSGWLGRWFDWRKHSLATIPRDEPAASQPRANQRPSSNDRVDDQQPSFDAGAGGSGSLDFDAFFLRYQRLLYTYLRRLLPTEESASDLTQETFFRAWVQFEQVRGYQRPEAWLYRVATNLALSQLRRRTPLSLSRLLQRDTGGSEPGDEMLLAVSGHNLADAFAERDIIARSLRALPERQRAALLLRAAHGFTVNEVAEMLNLSVINTYQLLSRGARRFREVYDAAQREDEQ